MCYFRKILKNDGKRECEIKNGKGFELNRQTEKNDLKGEKEKS